MKFKMDFKKNKVNVNVADLFQVNTKKAFAPL